MAQTKKKGALRVVVKVIIVLIIPISLTLYTIKEPAVKTDVSEHVYLDWKLSVQDGTTPYGYTVSLLLFIVPVLGIGWWFLTHPEYKIQKKAFWWSLAVLIPLGFVLDILFAHTFFTFPNANATMGIEVPVVGGTVPIEEFIFYITGFVVVLLTYLWAAEYWLGLYRVSNHSDKAKHVKRILSFDYRAVVLGGILILLAVIYKKFISASPEGFPWYFTYLVIASIIPTSAFLKSTYEFINWRAFSFTFFVMTLINLIWEATLAAPYGWWGYHNEQMIGIFINGWWGLPVEAALVWLMVTFTTVIIYEVIKIWLRCGKKAKAAFFG
jgi:hypothetical protein